MDKPTEFGPIPASPRAPDRESNCREHLQRVIDSATFHGSSASRKLLSYLGERTLADQVDDLKEYTIGVEALGRPAEYDPQVDPSVRVQISRLRKRLDDYCDREGSTGAFRIELPKRQFALRFVGPAAVADSEKGQPPPPPEMFWRRASLALPTILALALGAFLYSGGLSSAPLSAAAAESGFTPEMREAWQPYFESDLPVKLSLGSLYSYEFPAEVAPQRIMRGRRRSMTGPCPTC